MGKIDGSFFFISGLFQKCSRIPGYIEADNIYTVFKQITGFYNNNKTGLNRIITGRKKVSFILQYFLFLSLYKQ